MRAKDFLAEVDGATTSSSNITSIPNPQISNSNPHKRKPGKVKSVNALNSNVSLFGAVGETNRTAVIKR